MTSTRLGLLLLAVLLTATPAWAQRESSDARQMSAADQCLVLGVAGNGTGSVQVTGTFTGTITWTVSVDGSTYVAVDAFAPDAPGTAVNSTTTTGVWVIPVAGLRNLQACMTSYTSGTATTTLAAAGTSGGSSGGSAAGGDASAANQALIIAAIEAAATGVQENVPFTANDNVVMGGTVRRDAASPGTGVLNGDRSTFSVDEFGSLRMMLANGADGSALTFVNDPNHDAAGGTAGPQKMEWAVDFGATPANVTAADAVHSIATRAGIPFTSPGHPNMITVEAQIQDADGALTDQALVTVAAGTRIVVTGVGAHCDGSTTAPTNIAIGFGTANVPAGAHTGTAGVLARFDGIPAGGGLSKGFAGGILGIGADNEDVRYTNEDPAGGNCSIEVSYYTIATAA